MVSSYKLSPYTYLLYVAKPLTFLQHPKQPKRSVGEGQAELSVAQ